MIRQVNREGVSIYALYMLLWLLVNHFLLMRTDLATQVGRDPVIALIDRRLKVDYPLCIFGISIRWPGEAVGAYHNELVVQRVRYVLPEPTDPPQRSPFPFCSLISQKNSP